MINVVDCDLYVHVSYFMYVSVKSLASNRVSLGFPHAIRLIHSVPVPGVFSLARTEANFLK